MLTEQVQAVRAANPIRERIETLSLIRHLLEVQRDAKTESGGCWSCPFDSETKLTLEVTAQAVATDLHELIEEALTERRDKRDKEK